MSAYLSSEDREFLADLRVAMLAANDELTIVLVEPEPVDMTASSCTGHQHRPCPARQRSLSWRAAS